MKDKNKESPEGVRQRLKPGDVRVVNINGRPTTLVIGREYRFTLKEGAVACSLMSLSKRKERGANPKEKRPRPTRKPANGNPPPSRRPLPRVQWPLLTPPRLLLSSVVTP